MQAVEVGPDQSRLRRAARSCSGVVPSSARSQGVDPTSALAMALSRCSLVMRRSPEASARSSVLSSASLADGANGVDRPRRSRLEPDGAARSVWTPTRASAAWNARLRAARISEVVIPAAVRTSPTRSVTGVHQRHEKVLSFDRCRAFVLRELGRTADLLAGSPCEPLEHPEANPFHPAERQPKLQQG